MAYLSTASFAPSKLFDLTGRVAVVTGGGTGIGLMQAQGLCAAGAKVYIVGRDEEKLKTSVEQYAPEKGSGMGELHYIQGDVTSKESMASLAKELDEREGAIDIFFSTAGVAGPRHHGVNTSKVERHGDTEGTDPNFNPEHSMSVEEWSKELLKDQDFDAWEDCFRPNTYAAYFLFATFLPLLHRASERAKGKWTPTFVVTGSISGVIKQSQLHMCYNASKAAVHHLVRMLAFESHHSCDATVRVNAIAPGVFPSAMTARGKDDGTNKSSLEERMPEGLDIPAGRAGRDHEMGSTAQFLASNEYMHGVILTCDGGFTATEA